MRNRKKAMIAGVMSAVFLAACAARPNEDISSGEIVVPEMSSEDLLVTSLEYLLEDDAEEADGKEEPLEETDEQEITNPSENGTSPSEDMESQSGQESGEPEQGEDTVQKEQAVVYYGKGDFSELIQETIEIEEVTPDELIGALARHNIVPLLDTKVLSFEEEEQDGEKRLRLDLSKAFGEYLRTMSKEAECIIVASVTNTFLENYEAEALYLTVEGDILTTLNAEYEEALRQCTPESLMEMIESMAEDTEQEIDIGEEIVE